jgi:chromosome segregation ATPase
MSGLKEDAMRMRARTASAHFQFTDPVRGFDRRLVHGTAARLFEFKDASHAVALEVVAGSHLYDVVVRDKATVRLLLDKKCTSMDAASPVQASL